MSSTSGHVCFAPGQKTTGNQWVRCGADPKADQDTMWNRIIYDPIGNGTPIRLASREQISKVHNNNVNVFWLQTWTDLFLLRNAQTDAGVCPATCSKCAGIPSPVIRRPGVTLTTSL